MHTSNKSKTLTASITTKVTPDEQDRIKQQAKDAGLRPSEWCRQALLGAIACAPDTRLLLSEFLAVRRVFLALALDHANGRNITASRLDEIANDAEATKFAMADRRVIEFRKAGDL